MTLLEAVKGHICCIDYKNRTLCWDRSVEKWVVEEIRLYGRKENCRESSTVIYFGRSEEEAVKFLLGKE